MKLGACVCICCTYEWHQWESLEEALCGLFCCLNSPRIAIIIALLRRTWFPLATVFATPGACVRDDEPTSASCRVPVPPCSPHPVQYREEGARLE